MEVLNKFMQKKNIFDEDLPTSTQCVSLKF